MYIIHWWTRSNTFKKLTEGNRLLRCEVSTDVLKTLANLSQEIFKLELNMSSLNDVFAKVILLIFMVQWPYKRGLLLVLLKMSYSL